MFVDHWKRIPKLIIALWGHDTLRYIFFGGCTTGLNLYSFALLRRIGLSINTANTLSVILAILFAYVVNAKFVFGKQQEDAISLRSFGKFLCARFATMVIEVIGVWLLVEQLKTGDMVGKLCTQFIVLVLNYIFSKFLVFADHAANKTRTEN